MYPLAMSITSKQSGSSLIEVLVSLVLVAVTMLGLLGLQLRSMGMQKDSLDRRNAAILVASFADRIAGNFEGANAGVYSGPHTMGIDGAVSTTAPTCTDCSIAEIGQRDVALFQSEVKRRLPGGVANIALAPGDAGISVTVGWLDPLRESQDSEALKGTLVDANRDGIDDGCAAMGVVSKEYRCYVASIFP